MKRLLIAVLMVGLLAMPAFAAVQNVKVSGSVDSTWVVRDQFGFGFMDDEFYQNILITQAILRVDADLTDNVSAAIELINERVWGEEGDQDTHVDVNLAYVTLREMLYSPLTVIVGRQNLRYGNAFIIGDPDTNNVAADNLGSAAADLSKRKAFDAVRLVLDYDPLTIDVFAAKVDSNVVFGSNAANRTSRDDVDLYGINTNWQLGDQYNTEVEAYFFAEITDELNGQVIGGKANTVYVPGLHITTNPIEGLMVSGEVAWQRGTANVTTAAAYAINRDAMAAQIITSYAIPIEAVERYNPIVTSSYTWVSGDSNPNSTTGGESSGSPKEKWTAWDPMYEDQSGGTIYNTLFNLTNCHVTSLGLQVEPLEDFTTKLTWTSLMVDKEADLNDSTTLAMVYPDASASSLGVAEDETFLGYEIDADIMYDYTEDVQIGFSAGWFIPGDYFVDTNDEVAKQFLTSVDVAF